MYYGILAFIAFERYYHYATTPSLQVYAENQEDLNEFMWRIINNRPGKKTCPYPENYEELSWKDVRFALCVNGSKCDGIIIVSRNNDDQTPEDYKSIVMHPEYDHCKDMVRLSNFVLSIK